MRAARRAEEIDAVQRRTWLTFLIVLASCVGCDHATKRVAEAWLADAGVRSFAGEAVRFELASNPGAFLSFGADLPEPVRELLLLVAVPLLITFVCLHFARHVRLSRAQGLALALVAGGGIGNWLDRVLNDGVVTDFVSIGLFGLRTGIFNLADVAVVAGVAVLLVSTWGSSPDADRRPDTSG
jgi:signal peptidase II